MYVRMYVYVCMYTRVYVNSHFSFFPHLFGEPERKSRETESVKIRFLRSVKGYSKVNKIKGGDIREELNICE
jgi:hypothetical protein